MESASPWQKEKKDKKRPPVVGIVAEYNPFHNGHAYLIQEARRLSGAACCVVAMSGDFVQRGAPAVFDKYARARMALLCGADLVLEIPPLFAVSSAEDFAACAISLLDHLKIVTHLCFGSELGELEPLVKTAEVLCREPEEYRAALKQALKLGLTFPQARIKALGQPSALLSSPNNILGVEYLKALIKRGSPMIPVTVRRRGNGYHDSQLPALKSSCFGSASAIRKALSSSCPGTDNLLKSQVPPPVWEIMQALRPVFCDDFSSLLSYRLLELQRQNVDPGLFGDVSPALASRIRRQTLDFASFEKRVESLKTRQYTYTRVSRSLIHLLLHITKEDIALRKGHDYVSCFRVLGFKKQSSPLLAAIKKEAPLPLITKTADAASILDGESLQEFYRDLFCSHTYQSVAERKYGEPLANEYTHPVVIL